MLSSSLRFIDAQLIFLSRHPPFLTNNRNRLVLAAVPASPLQFNGSHSRFSPFFTPFPDLESYEFLLSEKL